MNLIYGIKDKPKFVQLIVFAFQQMLAIMAATLVVPVLVNAYGVQNLEMDIAAALLGAGMGTGVYIAFTKAKSPVFLGSSFAFLSAMYSATAFGYFGIIVGAILAGLVYVLIAIAIKAFGTRWIDKLMPPIIIGPTVAIIGLSLAGSAISDLTNVTTGSYNLIHILCGLVTLLVVIICSTFGKKMAKLIPFIIGILSGYALAGIFTIIGNATGCDYLKVLNVSALTALDFGSISGWIHVPQFAFVKAAQESFDWANLGTIAVLYMPVAFVVFAEHIADHKNLSSIIGQDLVTGLAGDTIVDADMLDDFRHPLELHCLGAVLSGPGEHIDALKPALVLFVRHQGTAQRFKAFKAGKPPQRLFFNRLTECSGTGKYKQVDSRIVFTEKVVRHQAIDHFLAGNEAFFMHQKHGHFHSI